MVVFTFAYTVVLVASMAAQSQSFALDMGSSDGDGNSLPTSALRRATSKAPSLVTAAQTTFSTSITALTKPVVRTTCIPNPTPTPNSGVPRSESEDSSSNDPQDNSGTPFSTAVPEADSKWPSWFTAATFTLVFYDLLTLGALLWCWVFGYLWWMSRGVHDGGAGVEGYMEMARMDINRAENGRREMTREWVRTGRGYGRVRDEAWERIRAAREVELEREMVRLGMI